MANYPHPIAQSNKEKGAALLLFAVSIFSILIVVCLGLELYLMILARQQTSTYSALLSEAVLRRFTLTRNDPKFASLASRQQDAIDFGIADTNSQLNSVIVGTIPSLTAKRFGRWNKLSNSFVLANTDEDANAVTVTVVGVSGSIFLDRLLRGSTADLKFTSTSTAAVDESLMQNRIYPHVIVSQ